MLEARKFSKESYDQFDSMVKNIVIDFIEYNGGLITKAEEDYSFDIEFSYNDMGYLAEVEAKSNYRFNDADSFPFETVSFTGRKLRLHNITPFWYIVVNYIDMVAIVCHSSKIYRDEYLEQLNINTEHRKGRDEFYRVPKEECKFINLNNYANT